MAEKGVEQVFRKTTAVLLFVLVVASDQLSKYYATLLLELGKPIEVIPGLFNLTLTFNPGAAFGMFADLPDHWRRIALGVVTVFAIGVVTRFMLVEAKKDPLSKYALVAIIGGAIGNLIDRMRYDSVVDFLDFYYQSYHWPAFNIADSAICIGVTILIIRTLWTPDEAIEECSTQVKSTE
jgi:signal peptidase II